MLSGCLVGVRVLDLSSFLPGPFCTQILADLGATVIKVEGPRGDAPRQLPGTLHEAANRNKRSVVLDLKTDERQVLGRALAAGADVVVEGFRPGVAARLGMSYPAVRAINPSIVYCSVSGFGQTGPLRAAPGHDVTYLAASGMLSVAGGWDGPAPRRPGVPVSDLAASTCAAIAILAALRQRRDTGGGAHLDLAITDAALSFASTRADRCLDYRATATQHLHPSNDLFEAADGVLIAIGAVEEHLWQRLGALLAEEVPALADPVSGPRTGGARTATTSSRCCGTRCTLDPPQTGSPRSPRPTCRRTRCCPSVRRAAPRTCGHAASSPELGAHTEQVLADLVAGREPWGP